MIATLRGTRRRGVVVLLAAGVAVLGGACKRRTARTPHSPLPLELAFGPGVRLVDSSIVSSDSGSDRRIARVAIDSPTVDTIAGLTTTDLPTLVGDSLVLGLATDEAGAPIAMFRYYIAYHRLQTLPVPPVLAMGATGIRVSPGGRWQGYVVLDSTGVAQGVIQRFPNGPILRRSTPVLVDWFGDREAEVEWTDPDTVVFYIDAFRDGSARWIRIRGGMDTGKWRVDTITVGMTRGARE